MTAKINCQRNAALAKKTEETMAAPGHDYTKIRLSTRFPNNNLFRAFFVEAHCFCPFTKGRIASAANVCASGELVLNEFNSCSRAHADSTIHTGGNQFQLLPIIIYEIRQIFYFHFHSTKTK